MPRSSSERRTRGERRAELVGRRRCRRSRSPDSRIDVVVGSPLVLGLGAQDAELEREVGARARRRRSRSYASATCGRSRSTRSARAVDDLRAELDEPLVPDVERRELVLGDPRAARRLQQAVALPQHPVVVGEHAGEPRGELHEQLVEEPAPARRLAAHEREVLRREQHGRDVPRQLARLDRDPVDLRAVRARPVELHLEQHLAVGVLEPGPHDRGVGAAADERLIGRDPVRAERAEVADRLDQVRLALAVAADEDVRRPGPSATSAVA